MDSFVTVQRSKGTALLTWGAEDTLPHPAGEAVNLTAAHFGMEEAIRAWRREHREALRWRSSFSYGGGRGVARVPASLAPSLAGLLLAFLTLADLVEKAPKPESPAEVAGMEWCERHGQALARKKRRKP